GRTHASIASKSRVSSGERATGLPLPSDRPTCPRTATRFWVFAVVDRAVLASTIAPSTPSITSQYARSLWQQSGGSRPPYPPVACRDSRVRDPVGGADPSFSIRGREGGLVSWQY